MFGERELRWSKAEKNAARAAFELALAREMKIIRREAESLLHSAKDDFDVWKLHDYLTQKRREIDRKYDYRYSVLILLFARLAHEDWLTLDELSGLGQEKTGLIKEVLAFGEKMSKRK